MLKQIVVTLLLSSAFIVHADSVLVALDDEMPGILENPSKTFNDMFSHRAGDNWLRIIINAREYPNGREASFLENVCMFKGPTQFGAATEMLLTDTDISDLYGSRCIDYVLNDGTRFLVVGDLHVALTKEQAVELLATIRAKTALAKLRSRL